MWNLSFYLRHTSVIGLNIKCSLETMVSLSKLTVVLIKLMLMKSLKFSQFWCYLMNIYVYNQSLSLIYVIILFKLLSKLVIFLNRYYLKIRCCNGNFIHMLRTFFTSDWKHFKKNITDAHSHIIFNVYLWNVGLW